VIGKWGETINKIIEKSGWVKIDFDDDGTCYVCDSDQSKIDMAVNMIRDIADDVVMNVPVDGVISRVEAYWLFIELPRNQSGLIHISQLWTLTGTIDATFKAGTTMRVMVTGKDDKGRLMIKKA
jgi:polyribonucleotide nucleotidyltransferase